MFKHVEYLGFGDDSALRLLAEQATAVLWNVMHDWRDDVLITWRPAPPGSKGILELTMTLPIPDTESTATGLIRQRGFEPGEENSLRWDLSQVWLDVLDRMISQVANRLEKSFADTVEA